MVINSVCLIASKHVIDTGYQLYPLVDVLKKNNYGKSPFCCWENSPGKSVPDYVKSPYMGKLTSSVGMFTSYLTLDLVNSDE